MMLSLRTGSLLAVLSAWVLLGLGGCSGGPEPAVVKGSAKAAKLAQCVEPTEKMRRNHMELIQHQRDATVHQGIRATKHSLVGCVDCHVQHDGQGRPVPVDAQNQFCDACHDKIGVQLTCFACHSAVPNGPPAPGLAGREPVLRLASIHLPAGN